MLRAFSISSIRQAQSSIGNIVVLSMFSLLLAVPAVATADDNKALESKPFAFDFPFDRNYGDLDEDGIRDAKDMCPEVPGPPSRGGCAEEVAASDETLAWYGVGTGAVLLAAAGSIQIWSQTMRDDMSGNPVHGIRHRGDAIAYERFNGGETATIVTTSLGAASLATGVMLLMLDDDDTWNDLVDIEVHPSLLKGGAALKLKTRF